MRVLVTGATGFVGNHLCRRLAASGHQVRALVREGRAIPEGASDRAVVDSIGPETDWSRALDSVDIVAHLAARVHVMNDSATNRSRYLDLNAEGTRRLAEASLAQGVKRFLFLSSVKVNGEATTVRPFTAADAPAPADPYAESKWQAERYLLESASHGMSSVIVRPPLVYGPGVRANFLRLMHWTSRGVPLPLGSVNNARSMISVWNLNDLLARLVEFENPPSRIYLASDGHDLSTPELIRMLATAMGRTARLLPVPLWLLRSAGRLAGKQAEVARIFGSLQVDSAPSRTELRWSPPLSVEEGIARTVRWFELERAHGD